MHKGPGIYHQCFQQQALINLHACREVQRQSQQGQSDQAEAWREERDALLDRVASLEDSLAASSASAAAAAEAAPTGNLSALAGMS